MVSVEAFVVKVIPLPAASVNVSEEPSAVTVDSPETEMF